MRRYYAPNPDQPVLPFFDGLFTKHFFAGSTSAQTAHLELTRAEGLILVRGMIGYPLLPLSLLSREFGQFYAMLYGGHIWEPSRPKMVPLNK